MPRKHTAEMLIEANKKVSQIIDQLESDVELNNNVVIDHINDVIRQLDEVVEHLSL